MEQNTGKKLDESVKAFFANVDSYFKSLNKNETIAWALIGLGLVLIILGVIFI